MKEYKLQIIEELNKKARETKIISLRETAIECGCKHLKTQECLEIANAFLKNNNDYKMVRMMNNKYDSIFCSLTFLDKSLEFEDK